MNRIMDSVREQTNRFLGADFRKKCDMLAFLFFCLFLFDCCFSGGGRYLKIGPFTPRMIMAGLSFVFSLPGLLTAIKSKKNIVILAMFFAFILCVVINFFRGVSAGHRMSVISRDVKGYMWLFVVPVALSVISTPRRMHIILDTILAGTFFQAVIVFAMNTFDAIIPDGHKIIHDWVLYRQVGFINPVSPSIVRIFMRSVPYMIGACCIVFFRQMYADKLKIRYILLMSLYFCAMLMSFTRSVYGALFVGLLCSVVILLILDRKKLLFCLKFAGATAIATLVLVFVMEFAYNASYLNFAVSRTFGITPSQSFAVELRQEINKAFGVQMPDPNEEQEDMEDYLDVTQKSDLLREQTQKDLIELIHKNPIFGNGLGAAAAVRDYGLDEYFYLFTLARIGVLGLLLYLAPFLFALYHCIRKRGSLRFLPEMAGIIGGMVSLWAITWFNPWMNAVLGIAWYAIFCTLPQQLQVLDSNTMLGE